MKTHLIANDGAASQSTTSITKESANMTRPLTAAAQARADLLTLAADVAQLAHDIENEIIEGAYTQALGYMALLAKQRVNLVCTLEAAALAQRN